MNAIEEAAYITGQRQAWNRMLAECLLALNYVGHNTNIARLIKEREHAIAALREVCAEHGDNDWPVSLNLADIIEKHLARHLNG